MRVQNTHHIALFTSDLARLRAFYTESLGLPVVGGFPGGRIIFIGVGGTAIELVQVDDPGEGSRRSGWDHLAWEVEDVDAEYAELAARGVPFHVTPGSYPEDKPTVRIAFFRDPDGNVIELLQPLGDRYPSP